jgi:hypothetical protein
LATADESFDDGEIVATASLQINFFARDTRLTTATAFPLSQDHRRSQIYRK